MDQFARATPGAPMSGIPAAAYNAMLDVVRDYRQRFPSSASSPATAKVKLDTDVQMVNASGMDLDQYSVVAIGDKVVGPDEDEDFYFGDVVTNTAPPSPGHPFAILQRPAPAGQMVLVECAGRTLARVNLLSPRDQYAAAVAGDYDRLNSSSDPGSQAVLLKHLGGEWYLIFIGGQPDTIDPIAGAGVLSNPAMTCSGQGEFGYADGGVLINKAMRCAGSGTYTMPAYTGAGALTNQAMTCSGLARFYPPGPSGTLYNPPMTCAGAGVVTLPPIARGTPSWPAMTCAGLGVVTQPHYTGTGALTNAAMRCAGAGLVAPAGMQIYQEIPSGVINGTNPTFTLSHDPAGPIILVKNGVEMTPGAGNDYTLSGDTITFTAGAIPKTGSTLLATYFAPAGLGSGITQVNGQFGPVLIFATGTAGADFNIDWTTTPGTFVFNLPDAQGNISPGLGNRGVINQDPDGQILAIAAPKYIENLGSSFISHVQRIWGFTETISNAITPPNWDEGATAISFDCGYQNTTGQIILSVKANYGSRGAGVGATPIVGYGALALDAIYNTPSSVFGIPTLVLVSPNTLGTTSIYGPDGFGEELSIVYPLPNDPSGPTTWPPGIAIQTSATGLSFGQTFTDSIGNGYVSGLCVAHGAGVSVPTTAWCCCTVAGSAVTVAAGINVLSVTYNSVGNYTVNLAISYASQYDFAWSYSCVGDELQEVSTTASSITLKTASGSDVDTLRIMVVGNLGAGSSGGGGSGDGVTLTPNPSLSVAINAPGFAVAGSGFSATYTDDSIALGSLGAAASIAASPAPTASSAWATFTAAPTAPGLLTGIFMVSGVGNSSSAVVCNIVPAPVLDTAATAITNATPAITLTGTGFDPNAAGNLVTFTTLGAAGICTAADPGGTWLTVQLTTAPTSTGALDAYVTSFGGVSNTTEVADVTSVALPFITPSVAGQLASVTTVTIDGGNFDPVMANNVVALSGGAIGTVTGITGTTQLVVTFTTLPGLGVLTAVVTTPAGSSNPAGIDVATIISAAPTVTLSTAYVNEDNVSGPATQVTIHGTNFAAALASNTVALSSGTGAVIFVNAGTTMLVNITGVSLGSLTAVVTANGVSSGAAVEVAVVVPALTINMSTGLITNTAASVTITGTGLQTLAVGGFFTGELEVLSPLRSISGGNIPVTADTGTSMTLDLTGPLAAYVLSGLGAGTPLYVFTGELVQIATIGIGPVVTPSVLDIYQTATSLTIGGGFFASSYTGDSVALTPTGTFTPISGSTSSITGTLGGTLTLGPLYASVTVGGITSLPVEVAVVIAAPLNLTFSGSNNQVAESTLNTGLPTAQWTTAARYKGTGSLAHGSPAGILAYGYLGGDLGNVLELVLANNSFQASQGGGGGNILASTTAVNDNVWHSLVATFDGTTRYLYLDGVQVASDTPVFSISMAGPTGAYIGSYGNSTLGQIRDVRIYNNALSSGDVATLAAGDETTVVGSGLERQWKCLEGAGTSLADSSSNADTATFGAGAAAPTWS